MKKIEAIIRPEKIQDVVASLESIGYPGVTVSEVQGHGKQRGVTEQWRGQKYQVTFLPKLKLEIVVKDADLNRIIKAISSAAKRKMSGMEKSSCPIFRTSFVSEPTNAAILRSAEIGFSRISLEPVIL